MIYTEVESHRASLRERASMLRLLWSVAGEPDITPDKRRKIRRMALGNFIKPRAMASTYIVAGRADV